MPRGANTTTHMGAAMSRVLKQSKKLPTGSPELSKIADEKITPYLKQQAKEKAIRARKVK